MQTLSVVNRSPKPFGSPEGDIPSYGVLEVPKVWWMSKSTQILVPADEYRDRVQTLVGKGLKAEYQRAGLPKLGDESDDTYRQVLFAHIRANTADPKGEARKTYLEEWDYSKELMASVSKTAKARDEVEFPPSRKPQILADFMVDHHGTPEEAKESEVDIPRED